MAYKGINFARQHLVPVDDGNLYRAIFQDGSLHGCQISTSGAVLTMTAGYIMCAGRQIEITADETFTLNEQTSGYARILLQIDLTQTATESTFQQVSTIVQYAATQAGFATLIQQDINNGGSLYQMQLALVSLAAGGISAIVEDFPAAVLRGGGGGGATLEFTGVASIPASTVTITNEALGKSFTKTLDADGRTLFKGLASGVWDIIMTDGSRTATGSIVIDTEYEKTIQYSLDLLVNGVLSPVMGNLSPTTRPRFVDGELIFEVGAGAFDDRFNSNEMFDASQFSTLTVDFEKQVAAYQGQARTYFGLTAQKSVDRAAYIKSMEITSPDRQTYTLDISDVSGLVYFQCSAGGQSYGGCWHKFFMIRLE